MKKQIATILTASICLAPLGFAQVSYTTQGATYNENFDAPVGVTGSGSFTWTDDTTLAGWYSENAAAGLTSQFPGGISATQVLYSFRNNAADVGAGSDRGFGTRTTSAGTFSYAFGITNNTGATLTSADVAFVSSLWRTPNNSQTDSLSVGYAITTSDPWAGLTFTPVGALGQSITQAASGGGVNDDPNTSGLYYAKSTTIGGLTWNTGDTLYLRFVDGTGAGAWGIDNFAIAAVPEPSSYALLAGLLGLSFVALRRRQA
jgi:hypothetical protein